MNLDNHVCDALCEEASRNGYRDNLSDRTRARRYGISTEQYWHLKRAALDTCMGCGELHQSEALCIDHDHRTGAVRGLLCNRCNRLIGAAGDSATVLRALADYLEQTATSIARYLGQGTSA